MLCPDLGQSAGPSLVLEDLVVADGEVEGEAQADGVGGLEAAGAGAKIVGLGGGSWLLRNFEEGNWWV